MSSSSSGNPESEPMHNPDPDPIYDVFLSSKSGDRSDENLFISHICTHLRRAGISVFWDSGDNSRSEDDDQISPSLLQVIQNSKIFTVVLSTSYASSRRCLDLLEQIIECRRIAGRFVLPVFLNIPFDDVRYQRHGFGDAFGDLTKRISDRDKVESWKLAFSRICQMDSRLEVQSSSGRWNEEEDTKKVAEHVSHLLDIMFVVEHPIGIEAPVQDVVELLEYCRMSNNVLVLGIWGMAGSGKTTLARAFYNKMSRKYESRSFLQDISEIWKQDNGKEKLLSDIKKDDIGSGKRTLLVLDDVDELDQLNALCGNREWFGSDSVIIITTRDKGLLDEVKVDHVYRMKEMDENEAATLFNLHAFKQPSPKEGFVKLSRDAVAYCGGLPLALSELGRELFGKYKYEWKRILSRWKRVPHPKIKNALKRSFDGLSDDRMKNVFLDIACFYVGLDQDEVIKKLNNFEDLEASRSVSILVERSLLIIDEMNRLQMHVFLREMGREIFRQQSKMSRIYDVFFTFSKNTPSSFTSRLLDSLEKVGISVYRDDTGEDRISPSLVQQIQRCRISVVIISIDFGRSRRFLEVLEHIVEYRRIAGHFVLPVFFRLNGVVLNQEHHIDDLVKMNVDKDKVNSWTTALTRIRNAEHYNCCSASYFRKFGRYNDEDDNDEDDNDEDDNDEDIKKIVERATSMLDRTDLFVAEYPVGVRPRVQKACQQLNIQQHKEKGVVLLGIWGMVGIGKTTIAKAIYNEINDNFEGSSFLPNITEVWEQDRRNVYLQERLLLDIFKLPHIKIDNIIIGKNMLKKKLSCRRVLVVLDDVNKKEQLDALYGSRAWFGPGSVIIITTRDRSLLEKLNVDHVYRIKEMDESESLELVKGLSGLSGSFVSDVKKQIFSFVSDVEKQNLVTYLGGLPLALEVEALARHNKLVQGFYFQYLSEEEFPHTIVQKAVEKCIKNDLNDVEKSIFFDIACFLNGMDYEEAMEALKDLEDSAKSGITALENRCLVTTDEMNKLRMHIVLQDVGRKIIGEQMKVEHGLWKYDVFLSFRGVDTRESFISHLYSALKNDGVDVFKDDKGIISGQRISVSLLQAIRRSRICVVVLSENYANSRWCLQELEYIMECIRVNEQKIIPVFYHVVPSSVREQTSGFGEAFKDLLRKFSVKKNKQERWRKALEDIAKKSGHEVKNSSDENELIDQIVKDITHKLNKETLFVAQHPVGVDSRVEHVIKLLELKAAENDVQYLGISGIGGIGKTTIAKAVYNQIRLDKKFGFEGSCFLLDIRESWGESKAQVGFQEKILSNILKKEQKRINNIESGKKDLEERLRCKRVLLILDNVDNWDQLKALCGDRKWFGSRSRIIITTRDEGLLRKLEADHIFRMSEMDNNESLVHFSWHAFKQASPKDEFVELTTDAVEYCGGLPLALEVIGSSLFEEKVEIWQEVLEKLKIIPNEEVQKKLRVSYDGLSHEVKEIFLDIAIFFIGMDRNDVKHILYEHYPESGISNLIDRNLITVDKDNKIRMHDLLRDMGREIVRQESIKNPEKRSRLWLQKDVHEVLQNQIDKNNATSPVEGLTLRVDGSKRNSLNIEPIRMMKKLRLLQLVGVQHDGDFAFHSRKLRWISWHGFPSGRIITSEIEHFFYDYADRKALVALELESNNLKSMWKKTQLLEEWNAGGPSFLYPGSLKKNPLRTLKVLNLSHSHGLIQIPDFSYLLNLEKLLLEECPSLSEISETIGDLTKIRQINLKNCKSLPNLPRSFYKLRSLEELIISGCSKIDKLEEDVEQMKNLITLMADNSGIKHVPFSIVRLKSIKYISICDFEGTPHDVFPSIIWSWMSPTNIVSFAFLVQESVGFGYAPMLVRSGSDHRKGVKRVLDMLDAAYCRELEARTTSSSQVSNTSSSSLIDFPSQFHISGSSKSLLIELGMKSHVTTNLREMILQELTSKGHDDCMLPLENRPAWFSFNCKASSVIFKVPPMNGHKLKTMMLCIVYSSSPDNIKSCLETVEMKNHTKCTVNVYKRDMISTSQDMDIISNMEPGSKVEVSVVPGNEFIVKKTTVYLIYDGPIDQTMEQQQEFIEEAPIEELVMVEDLEKREMKRKPTSITNYEVQPKAPNSQKTTPNVDTLIQEGSHQDQELSTMADATDPFPVTVTEDIVDYDKGKFNLDGDFNHVKNSQAEDSSAEVIMSTSKVGTAAKMRTTLEQTVQGAESHNDFQKEEVVVASHIHGQYSIPECIKVLKSLKEGGHLNEQFSFAVEMLKESENRVILISLKDEIDVLIDWILYKYSSSI